MPAAVTTIKILAGRKLMDRIRRVSRHLDIPPGSFIEHAIESELQRQEESVAREDRALEELDSSVLATGQAVSFHAAAEEGEQALCALCLKAIPQPTAVEGPLLCEDCLALAKGSAPQAAEPTP